MFRDWDWINSAIRRIGRDRAAQKIENLDALFAAMQVMAGNPEPYQKLRNSYLTPEQRDWLSDAEKRRIQEAKKAGGGITPRRRRAQPEPPGEEGDDTKNTTE
jgi:hypothetical protein